MLVSPADRETPRTLSQTVKVGLLPHEIGEFPDTQAQQNPPLISMSPCLGMHHGSQTTRCRPRTVKLRARRQTPQRSARVCYHSYEWLREPTSILLDGIKYQLSRSSQASEEYQWSCLVSEPRLQCSCGQFGPPGCVSCKACALSRSMCILKGYEG